VRQARTLTINMEQAFLFLLWAQLSLSLMITGSYAVRTQSE
jgi:hypothetical protein